MIKIPYAPPPPAGATVYSILAAADRILPLPRMLERITGGACLFARPLWPVALERIAQALPPPLGLTGHDLFNHHTLAPAFIPLLAEARAATLVAAMLGNQPAKPHAIACSNLQHRQAHTLLACPVCVRENPAWLRQHQLPGVVVCARHPKQALLTTNVPRSLMLDRRRHVDIRDATLMAPCISALSGRAHALVVKIAQAMATLVAEPMPRPGPFRFKEWMRRQLQDQGFTALGGKTDTRGATKALAAWLCDEIAEAIGIQTRNGKSDFTWFFDLMSERKTGVFPLWAVLTTLFLNVPITEALHHACDCTIPARVKKAHPKRLGISVRDERFESARTKLTKLWPRRDLSIIAVSKLLKTSPITVIRWAAALDLPFPRPGPTKSTHRPKVRGQRPQFAERVRRRRHAWIEACKLIPRGAGAAKHPLTKTLYRWLLIYDRPWLQQQLKARRSDLHLNKSRLTSLSSEIAVIAAVEELKQSKILRRASTTAIMRALGYTNIRNKPYLQQALYAAMAAAESWQDFTPRKLRWLHDNDRLSRRSLTTALKNYPEIKKNPLLAPILSSS